jgi:sodium-dependent dicarboxylate transporter 2/3/5
MVPNVIQVLRNIDNFSGECPDGRSSTEQIEKGVLLSVAYSASMGGMSSPIGTAPNLVLLDQLQSIFPDSPEITFIAWLGFAAPIGVIVCLFVYVYAYFKYLRNIPPVHGDKDTFKKQYKDLGPWTNEQKIVCILFLIEVILWMSRPAWSKVFPCPGCISDATVGMLIGLLLFLIPAKVQNLSADAIIDKNDEDMSEPEITTLLDWKTANSMPWDISKCILYSPMSSLLLLHLILPNYSRKF